MNRLLILTFFLLTFLFVTTFSSELVPHKEIYSLPLKLKKDGDNKLIAEVAWGGNLKKDEPLRTRFRCFSNAVTVKGPKHAVFGDEKVHFELLIHKKDVKVKCRYGALDGVIFKNTISFRT
ncbi:hypothetical protein GLOIN_2v1793426 [Rhizophagus clarus]|uniref:Uncharacterized protein n=1 Tax=Rhizophagus clarus TaxID=94130 RepID=A0A8H3MB07_9GLOM|nr:hypothetical protein GLOIN_2v1793426 [Rhizophagus clarus]